LSDVKWIKITTNMFDDEKVKLIEAMPDADSILVIWIKLLVQAGKTNASGYIFLNENIPYTDEMLSTLFNRPLNTIRFALDTFKKFGMIEMDENGIYINNWEKHQNIEGLEKIREQTRKRVQKHRQQKKLDKGNVTETLRNAPESESESESESEQKREEKNKDLSSLIESVKEFKSTHSLSELTLEREPTPMYNLLAEFTRLPPEDKLGKIVQIYIELYPEQKKYGTAGRAKAHDIFQELIQLPDCGSPEELLKEILYFEGETLTPFQVKDNFIKRRGQKEYTFTTMKYEQDVQRAKMLERGEIYAEHRG